jgi:hypothetical protein
VNPDAWQSRAVENYRLPPAPEPLPVALPLPLVPLGADPPAGLFVEALSVEPLLAAPFCDEAPLPVAVEDPLWPDDVP